MEDVEGVKLVFSFSIFFYLIAKLYNFFFLCYNNTILKKIIYSEPERLKECNLLALNTFKVKKADKAEVLSYSKLINITEGCTKISGDIYDKAVYLLKLKPGLKMEQFENLSDKDKNKMIANIQKDYKNVMGIKKSRDEIIRKLEKFNKLVGSHRELLIAIGKL